MADVALSETVNKVPSAPRRPPRRAAPSPRAATFRLQQELPPNPMQSIFGRKPRDQEYVDLAEVTRPSRPPPFLPPPPFSAPPLWQQLAAASMRGVSRVWGHRAAARARGADEARRGLATCRSLATSRTTARCSTCAQSRRASRSLRPPHAPRRLRPPSAPRGPLTHAAGRRRGPGRFSTSRTAACVGTRCARCYRASLPIAWARRRPCGA